VHVVVATPDKIVATLADAFDALRERHSGGLPSMLSFITGPSRTGDIERILVLGAHGPKELFVILVG
jgi:L-lactate dehydrogenase complex protein LldG